MKTLTDSTDSLTRIIVYVPTRGKRQYARNSGASSFTKKRTEAFHFAGKAVTDAVLARCNGGASFNCYAAFANF